MALNGSGAISLGGATAGQSVNLELGLSGTAQISFNDAAVRTLTGTTAGSVLIMPTNFYGKSIAVTETQTVTVGLMVVKTVNNYGFLKSSYGSITDGTFGFISEAEINLLSWTSSDNGVAFRIAGNRANSGWTKMTISGVDYTRASATYNYESSTDLTTWRWTSPGTNPFGTTVGATKAVVFTQ